MEWWQRQLLRIIILGGGFAMCLGVMTLLMILARRSRPAFTAEGELVMRYNLIMRTIFVGPCLLIPMAFEVLVVFGPHHMPLGIQIVVASMVFGFLLLCAGVALDVLTVSVILSDQGIAFYSWRKNCAYSWEDIETVSTYSWVYPFVFHGSDGRKFTTSALMTSLPLLVEAFRKNLQPAVYKYARRGIDWHGGKKVRLPKL